MWMLNRQKRYEIIRELIKRANPDVIEKLVIATGIEYDKNDDDIEYRREELLNHLDEMKAYWDKDNIDLIDKQYINIIEDNKHTR